MVGKTEKGRWFNYVKDIGLLLGERCDILLGEQNTTQRRIHASKHTHTCRLPPDCLSANQRIESSCFYQLTSLFCSDGKNKRKSRWQFH